MADKRFLEYIEELRRIYRPVPTRINERLLKNMGKSLKSLKVLASIDRERGGRRAIQELLYLACRSIDLLNHPCYDELIDGIVSLHTKKNAGYAGVGATDPWANFRTAEWFGVSAFRGCLVRMGDKFIRITHLVENPSADQVGEAITDTLHDLAVYSIIAICLLEEELSDAGNRSRITT